MTDVFAQQGINFQSSSMASTHPGATPAPIEAPKVDMDNAPANATPVTPGQPSQNSGNTSPDDRDYLTQLTDPQQTSKSLAGAGSEGSAPAGVAPPQPEANSQGVDVFAKMGFKPDINEFNRVAANGNAPQVSQQNAQALSAGIPLSQAQTQPSDPANPSYAPYMTPPSKGAMSQVDFGERQFSGDTDAARRATDEAKAAQALIDSRNATIDAATKQYGAQQVAEWQNNPKSPSEAIGQAYSEGKTLPYGHMVDENATSTKLSDLDAKRKAGEQLSDSDNKWIADYFKVNAENEIRGMTQGGKVAYMVSSMPAWVFEYLAAAGVGKYAGAAAEALTGAGEAANMAKASSLLPPVAKNLTTLAFMPGQYVPAYQESRVNDVASVTDKGKLVLNNNPDSQAMSLFKALAYTDADVVSAELAPVTGKYVTEPASKMLSTPIVAAAAKLPAPLRDAFYTAYKAIDPNATYSKMLTPLGWSNAMEALGSFQVDKILRGSLDYATDDKVTFTDAVKRMGLNEDDLLVTGGLMAAHGTLSASSHIMSSLLRDKGIDSAKADETTANMSAQEREDYVNQNLPLPKSPVPRGPMTDGSMSPGQLADHLERKADALETTAIHSSEAQDMRAAAARVRATGFSSSAGKYADPVFHADTGTVEADMLQADTNVQEQNNPPLIQDKQSYFNQIYGKTADFFKQLYAANFNDLQYIENAFKKINSAIKDTGVQFMQNGRLLISTAKYTAGMIERNWTLDTTAQDQFGRMRVTGKGLKPIYDDFDNTFSKAEPDATVRHNDFNDHMIAETLLEDHQTGKSRVTPEQLAKAQADVTRLAEKYGDDYQLFSTYAGEVRDWDNRILHNLVDSGLRSQAWYDATVDARSKYSPLQRLVEQGEFSPQEGEALGIGLNPDSKRIGSLKQRKGSDLTIRNTLESRMKNSADIIMRSNVNRLRLVLSKFAKFIPDDLKVSDPAIIRRAVDHSYDPILRTKLEQLVDFLGGQVKRVKQGDIVGDKKSNLGAYEPAAKTIHMREGSTEGTLTHEAGHMLDYILGLKERLLSDPEMKAELQKLSEDRLRRQVTLEQTPEGKTQFAEDFERSPQKYVDYVKSDRETLANFFDAWVNSPKQAREAAPKATAAFEKLIDENPQLAMLREIRPSTQRATETLQRELLDTKGPKNSLPFYDNGKLKFLEMSPNLYKAFMSLKPLDMSIMETIWTRVMEPQKALLQFGATHNLDFMMRHTERGTELGFINTARSANPVKLGKALVEHLSEQAKGIFSVLGRTQDYKRWASVGDFRTMLDTSPEGIKKMHDVMMGEQTTFQEWREKLGRVMNLVDQPQRIAIYKNLIKQGYNEVEAGIMSRDAGTDYGRGGSFSRKINKVAPFYNDMTQGADRFFRSQFGKNAAAFTVAATSVLTIPQLFITGYYLWAADDETRRQYLNFTPEDRASYMHVKIDGVWQQFARPFAPGFIYGAIPESIMIHEFAHGAPEPEKYWRSLFGQAFNSLSPVTDWTRIVPPGIKSWLEISMNHSLFRNQPIFKGDAETTPPEMQFDAHTSETAKVIGKAMGWSPAAIDNTVSDMSGRFGRYMTQLSDEGIRSIRKAEGQPVAEKPTNATDNPIYGGLISNPPTGARSGSYQEFREHRDTAIKDTKLFSGMEGQEADDYQQKNHVELDQHDQLLDANKQINAALKEIRSITQDTSMTGDEKAANIKDINDRILDISEQANSQYRDAKGQK